MPQFLPASPDFESRTRQSFGRQQWMVLLGANIVMVAPGEVHIQLPFSQAHSQQHGYVHAGAITSIVDSACGYAALTLMPANLEVVTVEFKVNFLSPAQGTGFLAIGKVVRPGRTITVCSGEVYATVGGEQKAVAVMQATMIAVPHG
jgi:uncharacterized protein (TIGR00369 family)